MVETAEQYKARLAAHAEGKDPVAMQRQGLVNAAQPRGEGVAQLQGFF